MEFLKSIPILSRLLLVESNGMTFLDALPLLANGILAGVLVAAVSGLLGVYVVLKRMVFVSAALSQVASAGVAVALLAGGLLGHRAAETHGHVISWPGIVSLVLVCVAALLLARHVSERRITRESVLGIAYVLPAGVTLLMLDALSTEAHVIEDILFGNTVFVPTEQLAVLLVTASAVFLVHLLGHRQFIFTSLDPETATACGVRTRVLNAVLLLAIAVTIAVSIRSVGALPVFAFMVVPASAALTLTERLWTVFLLSVVFGVAAAMLGFYLSFVFSLPTGPAMLTVAGAFLLPGVLRTLARRWAAS